MTLTLDQSPLQSEVDHYVSRGFYPLSQTETSAQLIRRKQFSPARAIVWFILGLGFGLIIYTVMYLAAPAEESIYLLMDAAGKVKRY